MLTYVRETLKCSEIQIDICDLKCLVLNIVLSPRMNFNIVILYNPPSFNVSFYSNPDKILKLLKYDSEIIVFGDFNINWLDKNGKQKLKVVTSKYKLQQQTKGPTRLTRTSKILIDLLFTNKPERVIRTYRTYIIKSNMEE